MGSCGVPNHSLQLPGDECTKINTNIKKTGKKDKNKEQKGVYFEVYYKDNAHNFCSK